MHNDVNILSKYLLALEHAELCGIERDILARIIDALLLRLGQGHSCVVLADFAHAQDLSIGSIIKVLEKSSLVGSVASADDLLPVKPIIFFKRLVDAEILIYITRYLHYEQVVATKFNQLQRMAVLAPPKLDELYQQIKAKALDFPNAAQLSAIHTGTHNKLSIITGGPGTGKTTSVVLILWLLMMATQDASYTIRVCAPTGKAAARVRESAQYNLLRLQQDLDLDISVFEKFMQDEKSFSTIHRLLGYKKDSIYFQHAENNPLPVDVLIIDEASMIGLPLFYKLLQAIDPKRIAHIVILGDPNQLSSVEEGYVFAALALLSDKDSTVELVESKRNLDKVGRLASAILTQDVMLANKVIAESDTLRHKVLSMPQVMSDLFVVGSRQSFIRYINYIKNLQDTNLTLVADLFRSLQNVVVLSTTNQGVYGVDNLNLHIEKQLKLHLGTNDLWYTGRAVIILVNDYALGLNNGDVGICLVQNEVVQIVFSDGKKFIPEVLPRYQLAYALTVHKAQGSEFNHVAVILNPANRTSDSKLLSRELLYTAVTRAKQSVTIYGSGNDFAHAITTNTDRDTGLHYLIQK